MLNREALQGLLVELFAADADRARVLHTRFNEVSFIDQATGFDRVLIDHKTANGIEYGYSLKWNTLIIKDAEQGG